MASDRNKLDEYISIAKEYFKRAIVSEQATDYDIAITAYSKGLSILGEAHDVAYGVANKQGGDWAIAYQTSIKKMTDTVVAQVEVAGNKSVEQKRKKPAPAPAPAPFPSLQDPAPPPFRKSLPGDTTKPAPKSLFQSFKRSLSNDVKKPNQTLHGRSEPNSFKRSLSNEKTKPQPVARQKCSGTAKLLAKHDEKYINAILKDVVDPADLNTTWNDITGCEASKGHLKETVVFPMLRPDLFEGLRAPPKGVLLFGPPGNGKTMLAKAVASEGKATFFSISAGSLVSKFLGDGEKMVRVLFACAEEVAPSVVFIDEVDSLLTTRGEEHDAMRRLKTEFLVQMDGVATASDKRVLVLAATNRPQDIDSAHLRRFPKRVLIPLPNKQSRAAHLSYLLNKDSGKIRFKMSSSDIQSVAGLSESYSFSDLTSLAREAAMFPLRDLGSSAVSVASADIRPICVKDFRRAMEVIKPSANKTEIVALEKWAKEYGSGG
eukprot:TRINITY_DN8374_c5_g1_i1.p1 TRINITY_DN8374_c5_g1~~TRINITY_DN8374_c5_g1_i1.p1  ORF type:complete len:489 (+),score=80.85 TRINITY_DN8374_c5_g1_i1:49-1515(+)